MNLNSSLYLLPLIGAFLLFVVKCYAHDNARVRGSVAFFLAMVCVILLMLYMGMTVLSLLPSYAPLTYGIVGLVMLGLSVAMLRR